MTDSEFTCFEGWSWEMEMGFEVEVVSRRDVLLEEMVGWHQGGVEWRISRRVQFFPRYCWLEVRPRRARHPELRTALPVAVFSSQT